MAPLRIGVDIGGTFTDAVAISPDGIRVAKVASNAAAPDQAVLAAVRALGLKETPARFLHGTTLVTNMLLERKGAETGFITTQGMRDILHIGRHERPLTYAIKQEIPQQHHPPVRRKWRRTVAERIDAAGQVIIPLDEGAVRTHAREMAAAGVDAIAIGFLHAYRYPEHEIQAARWVQEEAPDVFVCTSAEVSPRFREYERFLTTAWNARVAPIATVYLEQLAKQIEALWEGVPLTLMTSNGGLEEVDLTEIELKLGDLRRTPIRLALSGPAAAGNAVVRVTQELGLQHCVGLDVGGTSSDIVVVRGGRLHEAPLEERQVGGYPLQTPMLDLHTIGAGGGSLVEMDSFGTLHVGPQSAGARPGPACYGLGGTQPTVTDAAVVVGRLPEEILLGGTMSIVAEKGLAAFANTFQESDEGLVRRALDVLALAEANIAFAVRERTVARGMDPAELALVVAGGAGPLLACGVAEALELAEVIIPPHPGLLAAWGLLTAPDRREFVVTVLRLLSDLNPDQSEALFIQARDNLSKAPPPEASLIYTAALRYLGQGFEVEIPVDDLRDLDALAARFHAAHQHEYGFALPHAAVEWIELRVAWEVAAEPWTFQPPAGTGEEGETVSVWELRAAAPGGLDRTVRQSDARLVQRSMLRPGDPLVGPLIILEQDATSYIPTNWSGKVTEEGYLRLSYHV